MKKILIPTVLFVAMLTVIIAIQSCKKDVNGCTDSGAINFNSSATKDDNSCSYKGSAIFWIDPIDAAPPVVVTMGDGSYGKITTSFNSMDGAPGCNAIGFYTYSNKPGVYTYNAIDANGTFFTGSVMITSRGCTAQRVRN